MGFNASNQKFGNQLVAIVLLHIAILIATYVKMGYYEHILI